MKKRLREYVTYVLGFKVKLLNVPCIQFEGELQPDIDYEDLAEQIFWDLLKAPQRLTGDHLKFMRRHLDLKQEDMLALLGIEQGNFSRLEQKGDGIAFDSDAQLIALKAAFAKIKLAHLRKKTTMVLADFIQPASEFRDPEETLVRKIA